MVAAERVFQAPELSGILWMILFQGRISSCSTVTRSNKEGHLLFPISRIGQGVELLRNKPSILDASSRNLRFDSLSICL